MPAQQQLFPELFTGVDMASLKREGELLKSRARSVNTERAYAQDWKTFCQWCETARVSALPASAETCEMYVTHLVQTRKWSTAERAMAGIRRYHLQAGHTSPIGEGVRAILAAARRRGYTPEQKQALTLDQLREVTAMLNPRDPMEARDRCLLVLGFATGCRRSELAALDLADVEVCSEGLRVRVRSSKTDQKAKGRLITLPRGRRATTCPVRTLQGWLKHRGKKAGALFFALGPADQTADERLSAESVALVVKRAAARLGLDPADYGGHSLRAGLVTASLEQGTPEVIIMRRTGHKSVETLAKYARPMAMYDPLRRAL